MCIYIYREREMYVCVSAYIYIYIYICSGLGRVAALHVMSWRPTGSGDSECILRMHIVHAYYVCT